MNIEPSANSILATVILTLLIQSCRPTEPHYEAENAPFILTRVKEFEGRSISTVYVGVDDTYLISDEFGFHSLNHFTQKSVILNGGFTPIASKFRQINDAYYAIANSYQLIRRPLDNILWNIVGDHAEGIYDYVFLQSGRVILGVRNGIMYRDPGSDEWISNYFFQPSRNSFNLIDHLLETRSGTLFAGTHDGIYRSLNQGLDWEKVSKSIHKDVDEIYTLHEESDGTILAGRFDRFYTSVDNGETWAIRKMPRIVSKIVVSEGYEYMWMFDDLWMRPIDEKIFVATRLNKQLSRSQSMFIKGLHIRNGRIILYSTHPTTELFIGEINPRSDIWK